MHIGPPRLDAYSVLPESAPTRHKRSIDSSPPDDQKLVQQTVPAPDSSASGYIDVNVNPDPGKSVGAGQKTPLPVVLEPNTNLDPVSQEIRGAFKTVQEEASIFLKNKFAEMAAKATTPAEKEKWDIDPDNTYVVTYDYNSTGEKKPYSAKIIKRISLTEALIANDRSTPKGEGHPIAFFPGGPEVIVKPELKTHKPGIFDFRSRFHPGNEKADTTHTYQGIYKESAGEPAPVYNGGNQSALTPDEFRALIKNADYQKPYNQFLNEFWSSHEKNYPPLAKAALAKAAMSQRQEGSLSPQAHDLVMRATGLSGSEASWPDLTLEDLQKNPPKDPTIEVGLLKVGHFQSTDLMYITDNKVRLGADGKKLPPLTLLYIPGNSSPIHSFNSQAEMKAWFAEQMKDPHKREAMAAHFPLKDKPNGYGRAGIVETLAGLGTWPEKREPPGGLFSYDHRAFRGFWNPQDFIGTEPSQSPFDEVTKRQKDRSYADAAVDITSNSDVIKKKIISGLEKAAKAAMFLAPLALLMPEVALALDAFHLANGVIQTGIGIDDKIQGKPTGNERILFGFFNAAAVELPYIARAGRAGESAAGELESSSIKPSAETEPTAPGSEPARPNASGANRMSPSQWHDLSEYAETKGEQLIAGVTPNKGIYQVKSVRGEDRWFIRMTNENGAHQVYEIDGRFKLRNGYADIIDPFSKKPVMTVHATVDGRWEPINGPGGIKLPWTKDSPSADQFDPAAYDPPAQGKPSTSKASQKTDAELKKDASSFHKKAKTKQPPKLSDIPQDSQPNKIIDSVYQKSTGMVLGEDHSQSAGLRFLIDHADDYKSAGVKTLYSEGFEHSLQPDLDRFFDTGEFSPALRKNLKLIDRAHIAHEPYTNRNLLLTMRNKGIRVKAIDVPSVEPKTTRLKNMNYYATKVIERDQALRPGEKWVARVGSEHVFSYDGDPPIRGISQLTGATGITVDEAAAGVPTSVIQSLDKTELYVELKHP